MIPAARFFWIAGLATLLLAVGVISQTAFFAALTVDALLLAVTLLDGLRARRWSVEVEREWPAVLTQRHPDETDASRQEQNLSLRVRNASARSLRFRLRESLHPSLAVAPFEATGDLSPHHEQEIVVPLHPLARGVCETGPTLLRVLGPWRLCWAQLRAAEREPVRVFPRVRWGGKVGQLLTLAQRRELGNVALQKQGLGGELYSLRHYLPGDARNRIHWRASARRGHLVTREDSWERGTPLVVLLDCGRALSTRADGLAKLDHSLAACLALTRLASGRGDRVTIVAFSDRILRRVSVRPGAAGIARAYEELYDLEPEPVESLFELAADAVLQLRQGRSTVLFLTSVVDLAIAETLTASLATLRRRHQAMLLLLEDATIRELAESLPSSRAEAFAQVASLEILLRNRELATRLRKQGTPAVSAPADRLALETLETYLELMSPGTLRAG